MVRRAPTITVVLALLLSLQWVTAFAHCLTPLSLTPLGLTPLGLASFGTAGHAVEICTADGMRSMVLGEDGQERAPASHAHDSCPLCPGSAAPVADAPSLPAASIRYVLRLPPPVAGLPTAPARAPPQQPRAPPNA
jgi:hypothetical protein